MTRVEPQGAEEEVLRWLFSATPEPSSLGSHWYTPTFQVPRGPKVWTKNVGVDFCLVK